MSRKKLLLIDDEPDIREVATLALETMGVFEVITAESGAIGIERAASERPDAILLDYMMPGLDGPSTFERLRGAPRTREIPVIFLTAKVQPADRRRLADLGACGVLAKPFDPLSLSDQVAALLSQRKD